MELPNASRINVCFHTSHLGWLLLPKLQHRVDLRDTNILGAGTTPVDSTAYHACQAGWLAWNPDRLSSLTASLSDNFMINRVHRYRSATLLLAGLNVGSQHR